MSIQVGIKVRPLLKKEKDVDCNWRVVDNSINLVDSQGEPYYFDHIFDQEANNEIVFEKMAKHIVHQAVKGFNGTIFAYGQTSSGKTYTMMGDDDNPGVMVLAAKEIFKEIVRTTDRQFLLRVGYIEIYNEKIGDLLNKKNQDLKIHDTATGIVSVNCEEIIITCEEEMMNLLAMGNKERTVGETNMNERSSRSHAIFRIIIESRKADRSADDAIIQSVLNLVDLAGSERANQTGARGARLKEGGHINKSLLFLSNVIKRLSENEEYISYRDSKLTRILQASLGGNALTSIICTIKPTAVEETQSTLSFATRAKTVKNKPHVNEIVSDATMMKRLEREIKNLKNELESERNKNQSQIKVGQLEARIKEEVLKIISSNSLHNVRSRQEKRRRTWCPATTAEPEASAMQASINTGLPMPLRSIPRPAMHFTPHITMRSTATEIPPALYGVEQQLSKDDELFQPAELCNFDRFSPLCETETQRDDVYKTPSHNNENLCRTSITPSLTPRRVKEMELMDFMELEEFTSLEKELGVKPDSNLKEQLNMLRERNAILETEQFQNTMRKNEFILLQQLLDDSEKRCNDLQAQLDMEKRDADSLDFEFQRHKNKSKLREEELLSVLNEKDQEIANLQKSLNSKSGYYKQADLYSLSHSGIHMEGANGVAGGNNVCTKCEDLQKLHERVSHDFEKLTAEYNKLQLNFDQATVDVSTALTKLAKLEESSHAEVVEREHLRNEIAGLREQLVKVQHEHTQLQCENHAKIETCEELNRLVDQANQELRLLQEKYNKLETAWDGQQQSITEIQIEYDAIQQKYQNLQAEYEKLEATSAQSLEECARLQRENETLQTEIGDLKVRVEQAQQRLNEGLDYAEKRAENIKLKKELGVVQESWEILQKEYDDLSNQLMDNLQEGDELREKCAKMELAMKALQESNDVLTKTHETERKCGEQEIERLKRELEQAMELTKSSSPIRKVAEYDAALNSYSTESICSSGVGFEKELCGTVDFMRFTQLCKSLHAIELEHGAGLKQLFKAVQLPMDSAPCKLVLRNITEVAACDDQESWISENSEESEICMEGTLKRHTFQIVRLMDDRAVQETELLDTTVQLNGEKHKMSTDELQTLQATVEQLNLKVKELSEGNEELKALLESTEYTISELREQITTLSAELFEKSQCLEKCACEDYQRQIENLERTLSDVTMISMRDCSNESAIIRDANKTLCDLMMSSDELVDGAKEQLPRRSLTLTESLHLKAAVNEEQLSALKSQLEAQEQQLQCKATAIDKLEGERNELAKDCAAAEQKLSDLQLEHTQKLSELQELLEALRTDLQLKEQQYKGECNRLQLEFYEKLESNEMDFRENLRKYNRDWEEGKENYEKKIAELEQQLQMQSTVRAQNDTLANELSELRQELQSKEWALTEHTANMAEKAQQLHELMEKMQDFECEEREKLEAQQSLKEAKENIEALQSLIKKLEAEKAELEQAKAAALQESAEQRREDEEADHVRDKEKLSELQELYNDLLVEKTHLEADKRVLEANTAEIDSKLKNGLVQLELELEQAREAGDRLADEKSKLEKENSELQSECKQAKEAGDRLADEKSKLEKENSELQSKCEQIRKESAELADKLAQAQLEQKALEAKFCELNVRESKQTEKLKSLQAQFDVAAVERKELSETLNTLKSVYDAMEAERYEAEQKIKDEIEERQRITSKLATEINEKQVLKEALKVVAQESEILRNNIESLQKQREKSMDALQQERAKLQLIIDEYRLETEAIKQREKTLQLKLEDLSQELHDLKRKALAHEQLLGEREELEQLLTASNAENSQLKQQILKLTDELQNAQKDNVVIDTQLEQLEQLQQKLQEAELAKADVVKRMENMQRQLSELNENINDERNAMQKEKIELQSAIAEQRSKCEMLCQANAEVLRHKNTMEAELANGAKKIAECEQQRVQLESLKAKYTDLEALMQTKIEESARCSETLRNEIAQQTKLIEKHADAYKKMRALLDTKEAAFKDDKHKLEGTVSCLLLEKKGLEDKLHNSEETLRKLENEFLALQRKTDSVNNSLESNSSLTSPRLRKSLEQYKGMNIQLEDRLSTMQHKNLQSESAERKIRRLSTHDERRRQSVWDATRDAACMTDPSDSNCNCAELNRKLKECEKNLFIRESQVTALNIELKNHPLKTENASLIKRLQEEQERNRLEIKKYKQKLYEQAAKATTAWDALAAAKARESQTATAEVPKILENAETQTESELEECLHSLQSKNADLTNICRTRLGLIKALEDKMEHKENTDGSNGQISALEAGQLKALKSQCDKQQKDLNVIKQKYEDAKKVLHARRLEIEKLRALLEEQKSK